MPEIKNALELIIAKTQPEVVLEEWSVTQLEPTGAAAVSEALGKPWRSIGTADESQFGTFGPSSAVDFPTSANINRYGPFDAQERRECAMREKVIREIANFRTGILIFGLAHPHSMSGKLAGDFEVKSYGYGLEPFCPGSQPPRCDHIASPDVAKLAIGRTKILHF